MFKCLAYINDQLYEVELAKSEIEQKEPITTGFFILQYAKLGNLGRFYDFFDMYCDVTKFEELEVDTDSLYLESSEHNFFDYIRPALKKEWHSLWSSDCTNEISANSTTNFLLRTCCAEHKNMIDEVEHTRVPLTYNYRKFSIMFQ